jgi:hypothetical protein
MRSNFAIIAALSRHVLATTLVHSHLQGYSNTYGPPTLLHEIRSTGQNSVSIKSLAAIGDSYSAGIGAGNPLGKDISLQPGSGEFRNLLRRIHEYV